ncbi:hypothetical protein ACFX13_040865 [Malus domestica]
MESILPISNTDLSAENKEDEEANISKELDAGALFVLKSRGSWLHCGYHLTTTIVAPALLSLPYALSLMGWFAGALCLTISALVTFYSYNLLSLVLEHHEQLGMRQLRFRDMAKDILGPGWGRYFVGPIQFGLCYGAVIACILVGGQSLKVIISLIFPICATAGSVYVGNSANAPRKDYSLNGSGQNRVFGSFNAISIIATSYGNGIIPEIQATIAPPVKGKMFKGLCVCYAVVISTFFSVGISGYWAFGNQAEGTVLLNFLVDGKPLLPTWVLLMTNVFTFLQVSAVSVVNLQVTNEVLERKFVNTKVDQFSVRNVVPRLVYRSLSVVIATTVAAMFPFFGDINALIGAFGCIPLDFVLPTVFYNVVFKPSKYSLLFWGNTIVALTFSALGLLGAISSIRQIVLDSNTYSFFANI